MTKINPQVDPSKPVTRRPVPAPSDGQNASERDSQPGGTAVIERFAQLYDHGYNAGYTDGYANAKARADAAEAKLEEWTLRENDQARRAQAAEAKLDETNRLLTAYQHDVVVWKRERDEARAKLAEIRDAFADVDFKEITHFVEVGSDGEEGDCLDQCPGCALHNTRDLLAPEATR